MDLRQAPGKDQIMLGLYLKGEDTLVKIYFTPNMMSIVTDDAALTLFLQ